MTDYLAQMHKEHPRFEYCLEYHAAGFRPPDMSWPDNWLVRMWTTGDYDVYVHGCSAVSAEDALRQAMDKWIEQYGDD